jgi:hypothetical protein
MHVKTTTANKRLQSHKSANYESTAHILSPVYGSYQFLKRAASCARE